MKILSRLHHKNSSGLVTIILIAIAIAGSWLIRKSCPWGIGVGYDSYMYISSAESMAQGLGVYYRSVGSLHPLVHFPPMYPLAISILIRIGLNRISAATILSCLLFGINAFTAGMLVFHFTLRPIPAAIAASLFVIAPVLIDAHLLAMSEPLFYFLMLVSLGCLADFFMQGKRTILMLSAIAAALAILTRYIGVVLVGTGLIIIWINTGSIKRKVLDSCLFFLFSFSPMILWLIRNFAIGGSLSDRNFVYHPPQQSAWILGEKTLSGWIFPDPNFMPGSISWLFFFFALVCLLVAVWLKMKAQPTHFDQLQPNPANRFMIVLTIFMSLYVIFILLSLTFFDASTKLNDRILSPLYLAFLLIPCLIASNLRRPQQILLASILFVWVGCNLPQTQSLLSEMHLQGQGFNSKSWLSSPTVDFVRKLRGNVIIYSNESLPLEFLTGIPIQPVPEASNSLTYERVENIDALVVEFKKEMTQPGRILILFPRSYRPELPPKQELVHGLVQVLKFSDGQVYITPENLNTITLPQ